ncbi:MAG: hypothetical protein Q8O88_01105 [bacterium]|nr:hypothetical protein [bacterium]
MKIFKTSEQYLTYYYSKYNIQFRIQHWSTLPQPWCNYKSTEWYEYYKQYGYVNHREIFPDEIVFDIDCHGGISNDAQKTKTRKLGDLLCRRLKDGGFEFTYWFSGGNGTHIHLFFEELSKYNKTHRQILKKMFFQYIGKEFMRVPENEAHICQGNPILIQLELARHRKGGTKTLIDWNTTDKENQFPKVIMDEFDTKKTNFASKKLYNLNPDVPRAIQFLENEDFATVKDGRARALFVLACYYSHFMPAEEVIQKLMKWNHYQLRGYLNYRQIQATVKGVYKKKERPLFPYRYLESLMNELGFQADYSDLVFTKK